ncbi:MAG: hypothetical protein ACKO2P_00760 [Planctomycetota bacterium]
MKTAVRWAIVLCCALPAAILPAQTPQDARITIAHPGVQTARDDIKTLLKLTSAAEQKQIPVLTDFLDGLVVGFADNQPLLVQMLPGIDPAGYLAIFPLEAGFQPLRENLESLGYEITRDSRETSLYQFRLTPEADAVDTPDAAAADEVGWLRVLPKAQHVVAALAGSREHLAALRGLVMQTTVPEFAEGRQAIIDLSNPDPSADAQKYRREKFAPFRKATVDAIRKRPNESATVLQLRQLSASQLMDEAERVIAETQQMTARLSIDSTDPQLPVILASGELQAIPGTGLETAMQTFNSRPDAFAAIERFPGSALNLRINHPIDELRQKNMTAFFDLLQEDVSAKLKSRPGRTPEQKDAIDKVVTGIIGHLKAGIAGGWLNLFAEAVPDGKDSFNSVSGYETPAAAELAAVLPLMAGMSPETVVEMNLETHGDVAIHKVRLESGLLDVVDRFFGAERDVYIGIGPKIVWMSSGENALEQLKRTISAAGAPQNTTSPLHVEVALLPWTRQAISFYARLTPPTGREQLDLWRAAERRRTRAVEAMAKGNDTVQVHCEYEDGRLKTNVKVDSGVVRFIARQLAFFSKETLDSE